MISDLWIFIDKLDLENCYIFFKMTALYLFEEHEFPVLNSVLRNLYIFPQFLSDIHFHCHLIEKLEVEGISSYRLTPSTSLLQMYLDPEKLLS